MLDHVGLRVASYAPQQAFLRGRPGALATVIMEFGGSIGGPVQRASPTSGSRKVRRGAIHVACEPGSRHRRAFYKAALAAGGRDNGPRLRRSHPAYGAFVFDPDSSNVEAVCHRPD
jgi:catechol 2,3-dioxygenase-like lactoylglutathione lyase family enzyme